MSALNEQEVTGLVKALGRVTNALETTEQHRDALSEEVRRLRKLCEEHEIDARHPSEIPQALDLADVPAELPEPSPNGSAEPAPTG